MEAKDGPDGDEGQQMKQEYTFEGAVSTKARRFRQLDPETLPRSFSTNSNKEDLVLEYVANFEAQFNEMMPGRTGRVLFSPYNECDVRKFICTTVRPTELPHRDLYHAPACAQFVANLLAYEPLEPPTEVPDRVPSPLSVLQWRVGDSFDFALLLTSFLVGAGYDAYCVQGTAPRWITQRNESLRPAPELLKPDPESEAVGQAKTKGVAEAKDSAAAAGLPEEEEKYAVRSHGMPSSKFEAAQGAKARAAEAAMAVKGEADSESDADDDDDEEDPLEGQRVHCWVLVRAPSRDVSEHFFIEATTGATFPVGEGTPYQSVEAIWSSKNHYVNMQTEEAVADLRWELDVLDDWENVFIEPLTAAGGGGGEEKDGEDDLDAFGGGGDDEEGGEDDDGEENEVDDAAILDLPQSWVPKLEVDHALYRHRYSAGEQAVTLHRRSKFEKYAAFAHPQGLRERLSTFKDGARTIPKEIRERFENRDDKLYWRLRCPLASTSEEHFLPGRGAALRARHENHGRRRVLTFYPAARPDGLVSREDEIGQKYIMRFKDRDDYLVYRSVRVTQDRAEAGDSQFTLPGGQLGELYIVKMTEKYDRDPSKGPYDKIRKQTYYCAKGEIHTIYHFAPMRATAAFRTYFKDGTATKHVEIDDAAPRPTGEQLADALQAALQAEKSCYAAVRGAERELEELLGQRRHESARVLVTPTMFDTALEQALARADARFAESKQAAPEEEGEHEMDYLAPFLQAVRGKKPGDASREEAQKASKACLEALKERLLDRAKIIQSRLDAENSSLAKKQAAFQRSQRDHDQAGDEEFERFCSETMFRIQILEQRLSRHEDTAMQKYTELDQKLHQDPRLKAMHHH